MKAMWLIVLFLALKINCDIFIINALINSYIANFCGGCLIDSPECLADVNNIKNNSAAGNFSWTKIINNDYGITRVNGTTIETKEVMTSIFSNRAVTSKANYTIFMPVKSNSQINGVILYFHPTIFGNWNAPSEKIPYWRDLGIFYASQNFISIFPH